MNIKVTEERELELLYKEKDIKFDIVKISDKVKELIEDISYYDINELTQLITELNQLIRLNHQLEITHKMIICEHDFKNSGFSESKDNHITEIYYCNKCGMKVNYPLGGMEE